MQVAMDRLAGFSRSCPLFQQLLPLLEGKGAYLVGGAVRDLLIGLPLTDIDLILPHDPTNLAREFARRIDGHWFWLDRKRLQSRVVPGASEGSICYDFARFRAPSLEEDLHDRDFTINAMAVPLNGDLARPVLVDPCHGLDDLRRGVLRQVGSGAMARDPLRIVKGIRHATILELDIDPATMHSMRATAPSLAGIASERIRQEFWKLLADRRAGRGLQLISECGAAEQLFGPGFARAGEEMQARLAACRSQWQALSSRYAIIEKWLTHEVEQGLSAATLLLFIFLLRIADPELPMHLASAWKLSRRTGAMVAAVTALEDGGWQEFANVAATPRAFAWWAVRCQCPPRVLLLALAGLPGHAADFTRVAGWVPMVESLGDRRPRDLVDGHWLCRELGLTEGPEMSQALQRLRNAEIAGEVKNRAEARRFLARHCQNRD